MMDFLKDMLSEKGEASSKRGAMYVLLALFVFEVIYSALTGKVIDTTLKEQVFYGLLTFGGFVVASNIGNVIKDIKSTQVGPPPPQQ